MPYKFSDIIDIPAVQRLMESLWQAAGIPTGIIDVDGTVLIATGWQKICTQFHRRHPGTQRRCLESDAYISSHLLDQKPGTDIHPVEYQCRNGMVDIGVPIIIEGVHLATIFLGQFFYEDPDDDFFRRQAREFGFDEQTYLAALAEVPIFSRRKVGEILKFNTGLVNLLTRMGVEKLRQLEARQELRISENKFRALFDNANDGTYILDPDGRVLEANREACKELGYGRKELLQMWVPDLLSVDRPSNFSDRIREILKKKRLIFETVHRRKNGSTFPVEVSVAPFDYLGQPALLATFRNISKRKEGEQALRKALTAAEEERDKITAILKSVADGLVVTDLKSRIVLMNRTAETLAGTTLGEAFSRPINALFPGKGLSQRTAAVLAGKGDDVHWEWEIDDGGSQHHRTILARTAPVQNRKGETTGTITLLRDVTRERDLDRMKDEFISTAAHELRTPLTSVMGFSEILLSPERYGISEESRKRELMAHIHQKAQRLETIISDLLDLSKVKAGQMIHLCKVPVEIGALLRRIIAGHPKAENRIVLSLPPHPTVLDADPAKLEQVLDNLISNAIKFSSADSTIRISGEQSGTQYRIVVKDEGIGMTPAQVKRIFDKFYRVDASNTAQEGLGLGMSIVRNIVEAHGGIIAVESHPKGGTAVTFTLPLPGSGSQEEGQKA